MSAELLRTLSDAVERLVAAGAGVAADDEPLRRSARAVRALSRAVPALVPLADAAERAPGSPHALLDLLVLVHRARPALAAAAVEGALTPVEPSGPWTTDAPPEAVLPFVELTSEPSPVRRRNRLRHAIGEFTPQGLDMRQVGPLLRGLEEADHWFGGQIAEHVLPAFGAAVVPELRRELNLQGKTPDAGRLVALCAIDPAGALGLCREALAYGADLVQAQALQSLIRLAPEEAEETALDLLVRQRPGPHLRKAAIAALASSHRDDALEPLLSALGQPRTTWAAYHALRQSAHPQLVPRLLQLLGTTAGPKLRYTYPLLSLLAESGDERGLAAVVALLDHTDDGPRKTAISILQSHGWNSTVAGTAAIPELLAALRNRDVEARRAVVTVLSKARAFARQVSPALVSALEREEVSWARAEMLAALGRLATPAAVVLPALTAALRDPAEYPRRQAVESLATFGARARPALPALKRALKDPASSVRAEAARALACVAPRRAILPILLKAMKGREISGHVANVLGQIGRPARAAVPALVRLLQAADGWTRWRAIDALRSMGPAARPAVLPLAALLQEQDPRWAHYIRPSAAAALGKLGPAARAAVPALLMARRDRNPHLRQVIDDALAAIGPPS